MGINFLDAKRLKSLGGEKYPGLQERCQNPRHGVKVLEGWELDSEISRRHGVFTIRNKSRKRKL